MPDAIELKFRPPLAFDALLEFFAARAIPGVAAVVGGRYRRTLAIGGQRGWLSVERSSQSTLMAHVSPSLAEALPQIGALCRRAFDLDAEPSGIAEALGSDPLLGGSVARTPGLRVPGSFDAFELTLRTIVGQQVSVAGATTIAGRIANNFGEPVDTPWPELGHLTPSAERIAEPSSGEGALETVGIPGARARALRSVAHVFARGEVRLDDAADLLALRAIKGIGPWTVNYLAIRGLRDRDAFLAEDLVLRRNADLSVRELRARAEAWRPFRAYAAMHLWRLPPKELNKAGKKPAALT